MEVLEIVSLVILCGYLTMIIWLLKGVTKNVNNLNWNPNQPTVSVIVALHNERENVPSLIQRLKDSDYPAGKWELILVNDNSTDNTYELLKQYSSDKIKVVQNKGTGKKQAIETGVSIATGTWVAITDADCVVPQSWIKSMVRTIELDSKMILGPVFINKASCFIESLQHIEFLGLQATTAGSAGMNHPISANAANMMFRKDVFEELKPYQNNYHYKTGDDQFLLMTISSQYPKSVKYSWSLESVITTYPVKTWSRYFEQRIRWASKGAAFTQNAPKLIGGIVFGISLLLSMGMFYFLFEKEYLFVLSMIAFKSLADLLLINRASKFSEAQINPSHYLFSTVMYPFVVVISVMLGFFKKKN